MGSVTDSIKPFIVVFANGVMMVLYCVLLMTLNEGVDFKNHSIDSTFIKAHLQRAGTKKGL